MSPTHPDAKHAGQRYLRAMQRARPATPDELWALVHAWFDLDVGRSTLDPRSTPPMRYLDRSFFDPQDLVVWASRGAGKTLLGAVATMLELAFRPGVQVRILAGSLEQGQRMYEHLRALADRPILRPALTAAPTQRRLELAHGSRVEVLAGSQRSVRGVRVHRLRCDEVDELDPDLWQAAQLTTLSQKQENSIDAGAHDTAGPPARSIPGSIEALSTLHRPHGLMADLTRKARADGRLLRWNALDVAARCEPERPCEGCPLWNDCRGRAKHAHGFVPIEDLIQQRLRVSDATWDAEMMCRRPTRSDLVYPAFTPDRHVSPHAPAPGETGADLLALAGLDLGLRSPSVWLWALADRRQHPAPLYVLDELARQDTPLDAFLTEVSARAAQAGWPRPEWVGVDPAGRARNLQTGMRDLDVLRAHGYRTRTPRIAIAAGVDRVRARLDHGRLRIHPRCEGLIQALEAYHFDRARPDKPEPVKDGPDHWCDALRYLVGPLDSAPKAATVRQYA
ncbi:MAG: hypothetical protein AAF288_03270 [Planctomycetota bacterium]